MRYERVIDIFLIYSLSFGAALLIARLAGLKRWRNCAAGVRGMRSRVGTGIPFRRRYLAYGADRVDLQFRVVLLMTGHGLALHVAHGTSLMASRLLQVVVHGRKPSKIIWSAQRVARCRSAGVRTAQVSSGMLKTCRANKGANAGRSAMP